MWVLRYFLPYNNKFHKAACLHDILYTIKREKLVKDSCWLVKVEDLIDIKYKADIMFFKLMYSISNNKIEKFFAKLYFFLVSTFWIFFLDI